MPTWTNTTMQATASDMTTTSVAMGEHNESGRFEGGRDEGERYESEVARKPGSTRRNLQRSDHMRHADSRSAQPTRRASIGSTPSELTDAHRFITARPRALPSRRRSTAIEVRLERSAVALGPLATGCTQLLAHTHVPEEGIWVNTHERAHPRPVATRAHPLSVRI